jgi:hypothetical protein
MGATAAAAGIVAVAFIPADAFCMPAAAVTPFRYAGEEAVDYESTCRGRIETGQQTQEWAYRWDDVTQSETFGYYCGCSGCVSNCWSSVPGATPRDPSGAFNCSAPAPGTLPPYPKANKYWPYWFTGDNFEANTNPNTTSPGACNDPLFAGGANNFPYPICKGRTAAFGEEWGTMDSDFTCKTFNSLVVDSPRFMCTTNPADKVFTPPPAVSTDYFLVTWAHDKQFVFFVEKARQHSNMM